jgi:putative (di)nucleoside polyphosphate hydrolase
VGIVLLNEQRRVFVGKRFNGSWHMPQGGLEDGEAPRDAAFRELHEETGTRKATVLAETESWLDYLVPPKWRPPSWEDKYDGQTQKWFCMRYDGDGSDLDLATHHDPEFEEWRWATPDEAIAGAIEFKTELYPRVFASFAEWL